MRRMVDDKEMITIDNRITALEQGGVVVDAYTKAQTDALLLTKVDVNKHFDDDDNPEDYRIKQPQNYGDGIELHASRDDNHHPDYANLAVTPTHVIMLANSANHGDNDDDYTGSIDITDSHVTLDVTDGENTTTLQIGANSAKLNNVQIATMNDIPSIPTLATVATTGSYNDLLDTPTIPAKASTYTLALGTASDKFWFATITAEAGLEGSYGPENSYDWYTFITKYARYVNWYYENANDTSGNNHKSFIIKNPGQTLLFYGMDGSDFVPVLPPTVAYLTVTKTN